MSFIEIMDCTSSLIEILETKGGFSPIENRKGLEPRAGLSKIWMPSSELSSVLFSPKPVNISAQMGLKESVNILEKLVDENRSSQATLDGNLDFDRISLIDSGSYTSSSEASDSVIQGTLDSSIEGIEDERIDHLKRMLKQIYDERLAAGAEALAKYTVESLENQLFQLVNSIRSKEKKRIKKELRTLSLFMDRYLIDVNRENGHMLKRKYVLKRKNCITRIIDNAEESFASGCFILEKELQDKFYFRAEQIRNHHYTEYKKNSRGEIKKWVGRFKDEKNKIMEEHENKMTSIKEKYDKLYQNLDEFENNLVQEEIQKLMPEKEETQEEEPKNIRICSDDSSWLCILNQLLTDLQQFMKKYISSEADVKNLLNRIKLNRPEYQKKRKIVMEPKIKDIVVAGQEQSMDSVPCVKDRDEKLHRVLLSEATAILEDVINNIVDGKLIGEHFWKKSDDVYQTTSVPLFRIFMSDEDISKYRFKISSSNEGSSSGMCGAVKPWR